MTAPTERQVLYALVAGAWFAVVAVLTIVGAVAGLSPAAWTVTFGFVWLTAAVVGASRWRNTAGLLVLSLLVFVLWAVGTLLTR